MDVTVNANGSGTVTVTVTADNDAVTAVPELVSGLVLDDIVYAGWESRAPQTLPDGGVVLEASKEFRSAAQLQAVLDELAGPNAIFSNVTLEQSSPFARTEWLFSVDINPSPPLEIFSDVELAKETRRHIFRAVHPCSRTP